MESGLGRSWLWVRRTGHRAGLCRWSWPRLWPGASDGRRRPAWRQPDGSARTRGAMEPVGYFLDSHAAAKQLRVQPGCRRRRFVHGPSAAGDEFDRLPTGPGWRDPGDARTGAGHARTGQHAFRGSARWPTPGRKGARAIGAADHSVRAGGDARSSPVHAVEPSRAAGAQPACRSIRDRRARRVALSPAARSRLQHHRSGGRGIRR